MSTPDLPGRDGGRRRTGAVRSVLLAGGVAASLGVVAVAHAASTGTTPASTSTSSSSSSSSSSDQSSSSGSGSVQLGTAGSSGSQATSGGS